MVWDMGCVNVLMHVMLRLQSCHVIKYIPHPLNGLVNGLQRLQSLRHENVRELPVYRLHSVGHLQDPLLVGVGGVVVRGSAGR